MYDANDVYTYDEKNLSGPKAKELSVTMITDSLCTESNFYAGIANGKYIRMSIKSFNDANLNIVLYIDQKFYKSYKIDIDNQGLKIAFTLNKDSDFKIIYEVTNGVDMEISGRARQYEIEP